MGSLLVEFFSLEELSRAGWEHILNEVSKTVATKSNPVPADLQVLVKVPLGNDSLVS